MIAAVKDAAEAERARAALPGATVLTTSASDYADTVRHGADLVFDTVGNPLFASNLSALADDGTLVVIAARPGQDAAFDLSQFYRRRLRLIGVSSTRADAGWCAGHLHALADAFANGALPPVPIARRFALEDAAAAYALVASGTAGGRVILTMGDG